MRLRSALLVAGLVALGLGLSGCTFLRNGNVFKKVDPRVQAAIEANRIPVIAADQTLAPAANLAGKDFTLPTAQAMADWPLPGGNLAQAVGQVAAAPNFRLLWSRDIGVGSGRGSHVTAPPIAAGGKLFVMDGQAGVRAVDARSGATLWKVDLRPNNRRDRKGYGGGLAYDNGRVFVVSGYRFAAALDAATGAVVWRTAVAGPIHAAPTVSGGRVFAVDNDNQMVALDETTGQLQWTYSGLSESARILAASSPAVVGDTLVAAFSSGEVVRLRASTGAEIWAPQSIERAARSSAIDEISDIAGRPAVYDDVIYASSHSGVTSALDLATGNINWSVPVGSIGSPWAAGDVVYITSQAGQVICISRANGDIYWIRDLNAGNKAKVKPVWTGPILASNRLIVANNKGQMVALDPKTGTVNSQMKIGGAALIAPMAAGGQVYLVTDNAKLIAVG